MLLMFYCYMMHTLNSSDIRVAMAVFDGKDRLRDIARAVGLSVPRTSVILTGLAEKGLVEKRRRGMSGTVALSGSRPAHLFRELLERRLPAVECLADSKLTLVSVLAGNGGGLAANDLAAFTGLSRGTVRNFLATGMRYGVLKHVDGAYAISSRMGLLSAFVKSYEEDIAGRVIGSISRNSLIHRMFGFETVFSLPPGENAADAVPTAATAFMDDGVPTRGNRRYYHHVPSGRTLRREDYIMDNVLLEPGNIQNLTVSLIYLKKHRKRVDADYLRLLARVYGVPSLGDKMLQYADGRDIEGFPRRAEFVQKFRMYGDTGA
jgi:hypothetical protein